MAVQSVIMINLLLVVLTNGLAEEPPISQPGCKITVETLQFHTPLELDTVVTLTTGSKLFAMELEPS